MWTKALILALACTACGSPFPKDDSWDYTNYPYKVTGHTPGGVAVDDPKNELDLDKVDAAIAKTTACLQVSAQLPEEFGVLIPPDWYTSTCGGDMSQWGGVVHPQVFPCDVGPEGCEAKGLHPTADCPCRCRASIQDRRLIVTAPDLIVFPGRLVTLLTGEENPWGNPALAPCSNL